MPAPAPLEQAASNDLAPRAGRLTVRLAPVKARALREHLARGEDLGRFAWGDELGALSERYGVRAVRGVFDAASWDEAIRGRLRALAAEGRPVDPARELPHLEDVFLFELDPALPTTHAALDYERAREVVYAEPLFALAGAAVPPDASYPLQWAPRLIGAEAAWDVASGAGQTIAIIDSGMDGLHADIASQLTPLSYDACTGAQMAVPGDPLGHGTHVAGIAAAAWDGSGVAGMAPSAALMSVGVVANGDFDVACLPTAISYAAANGADVINASLATHSTSRVIEDAVQAAHAMDAVFVAAAGNDTCLAMAAPANIEWAVTVGAVDANDVVTGYSNRGTKLDVVAPGGDGPLLPATSVLSSWPGGGVQPNQGTSMAAPHVAGLAALLRELAPSWTNEEVRSALRATAADTNAGALPGFDTDLGHGRVDAEAATRLALGGLPLPTAKLTAPKYDQHIRSKTKVYGLVNVPVGASGQYTVETAPSLAGPFTPLGITGNFVGGPAGSATWLGNVAPGSFAGPGRHILKLTTVDSTHGTRSVDYDEIEVCGSATPLHPGAVAWWKLERATWPSATDSVGANHGSYFGVAAPGPNGQVQDGAGFFGHPGAKMEAPAVNPPSFYYLGAQAWLRAGRSGASGVIASYRHPQGYGWELGVEGGGYYFATSMNGGVLRVSPISAMNSQYQWQHLAVSVEPTQPGALAPVTINAYLNGVLVETDSFISPGPAIKPAPSGGLYRVGGGPSFLPTMAGQEAFQGNLDEVQIFSGPLTPAQIQATYAAGCGGHV